MNRHPRLVIVGRPNVGKSTLFNRLLGRRRSLVHDEPGVTRDRIIEEASWWVKGHEFPITLVDTGGMGGERFAAEIENQVNAALKEADVAVLVLDGQTGLTTPDRELLRKFHQSGVQKKLPLIGVVNKVDAEAHEMAINEFYETGLDPLLTISAEHGRGIDELQEAIARATGWTPDQSETDTENWTETETDTENWTETETETEPETERDAGPPRIAVVGRPNVGKSTLVNAILGEQRMIVSPIAGTTVDSVDSVAELDGKPVILIDTAGIRRKSKTEQGVEVLSVVQTRKALERANIAILMLDGESGITDQDEKIGGLIEEVGCSVILAINKWDTQRKNPKFTKDVAAEIIRKEMGYLRYAPVIFTSGKTGEGLEGLGELIEEILHQRKLKIPTHEFTEWVRKESTIHNPMNAKFYMCHQSGRHPPTFVCHVSDPDRVHFSLRRHLINALRERWGYMGTPVRMLFIEPKGSRPARKRTERDPMKVSPSRQRRVMQEKAYKSARQAPKKSPKSKPTR